MTLDDAALRRVFVDAPADTSVPSDVRTLYRARIARLSSALKIGAVASFVVGCGLALAGLTFIGVGIAMATVVAVIIVALVQYGRAQDDFFRAYATARGLTLDAMADRGHDVPLLRRGDEQEWKHTMQGSIAGQPATLALYTYTEITRDSKGNTSRSNYDFTLLRFRLPAAVAARFAGVYLAPKSLSLGALQDKLSHDRKVQLESQDFAKLYSLRVVDAQDDIALFELFSPPFIELLTNQARVYWEQVGDSLVFYHREHEKEAADLDRFCLESWHVLQRYLEEHR